MAKPRIRRARKSGFDIKADIHLNLRSPGAVTADVFDAIQPAFEKNAQNIIRDAASISLAKGIYDTGLNFSSLGWAISPHGTTSFEPVRTIGTGHHSASEIQAADDQISTIVVTTSGYGGWLEVGSQGRQARTFITPAALKNVPEFGRLLTGIIK